jgi:hypothetical protein
MDLDRYLSVVNLELGSGQEALTQYPMQSSFAG